MTEREIGIAAPYLRFNVSLRAIPAVLAGIRSLAATAFGKHGTEKCLPALAKAAATDPTTEFQLGCMGRSERRQILKESDQVEV
jgi:hypothetical protein